MHNLELLLDYNEIKITHFRVKSLAKVRNLNFIVELIFGEIRGISPN